MKPKNQNQEICECGYRETDHIDYFGTGKKNVCPFRKSMKFKPIQSPQTKTQQKAGEITAGTRLNNNKTADNIKELVIERIKQMPDNLRLSIG